MKVAAAVVVLSSALAFGDTAVAEPAFQWKELRLSVPATTSGGVGSYDSYVRTLGRYIGKYLPGHPAVITVNRPGAGGMTMANYIYNQAPKDGTEIGMIARALPSDRLVRGSQSTARFDTEKFNWVGNMNVELPVFILAQQPPVSAADLQEGREVIVSASGVGTDADLYAILTRAILGAKIKVIAGYAGSREMYLALEKREVDGIAAISWGGFKVDKQNWLNDGTVKPVLQMAFSRSADLPDVPALAEFVKSDLDRKVLEFFFFRQEVGRGMIAPPGVPKERVQQLRSAFDSAMRDPDLIGEAKRTGMEIHWTNASEVESRVTKLVTTSRDVLDRVREIFGP